MFSLLILRGKVEVRAAHYSNKQEDMKKEENHNILISLANIDANIHSKTSLHSYLLLVLLPIPKFVHKNSHICGLLKDWLFHQMLNHILAPLKTAATMKVMMSDLVGNLWYCYTPLVSWIANMPEECLISTTSPKAFPVTTTTSKHFGDSFCHPPYTGQNTLLAIWTVCAEHDPPDFKNFLKVIRCLSLNGLINPC